MLLKLSPLQLPALSWVCPSDMAVHSLTGLCMQLVCASLVARRDSMADGWIYFQDEWEISHTACASDTERAQCIDAPITCKECDQASWLLCWLACTWICWCLQGIYTGYMSWDCDGFGNCMKRTFQAVPSVELINHAFCQVAHSISVRVSCLGVQFAWHYQTRSTVPRERLVGVGG